MSAHTVVIPPYARISLTQRSIILTLADVPTYTTLKWIPDAEPISCHYASTDKAATLRTLKTMFRGDKAELKRVARDIVNTNQALQDIVHEDEDGEPDPVLGVSASDRLETCQVIMPRVENLKRHLNAIRLEHCKMMHDLQLHNMSFGRAVDFNCDNGYETSLYHDLQNYMDDLSETVRCERRAKRARNLDKE
jgi:hypothetical protein